MWYKIDDMIRPCHCSFPRNTSTFALRHGRPWVTLSAFLSWIWWTIQEVILCVICVSFKNSLFFEANYRFDKHSGFHVCLAKTFWITVLTDTSVIQKVKIGMRPNWILSRIHHWKMQNQGSWTTKNVSKSYPFLVFPSYDMNHMVCVICIIESHRKGSFKWF